MSDFTRCNKCAASRNCTIREEKVNSKKCSSFIESDIFSVPLLIHLMNSDSINNTIKLLNNYGFIIEEREKSPFFILRLS